jgi:hypothetical protein
MVSLRIGWLEKREETDTWDEGLVFVVLLKIQGLIRMVGEKAGPERV